MLIGKRHHSRMKISILIHIYYRPRSVASECYVSTGVCHFNSGGAGEVVNTKGPGHNTPLPPGPGHGT